ncbi:Hypothetical protein PSM36_2416 [Proteiniphilum saccharofermentans]|uniref:DUF2089 family protein n=1 Tax=Proteiniphilum saccharofermentans TaxID=1642647 RepID=A0A1R3T285_9BACT|nr:DUF2089 family protein [Proteiniphilum saccharofermentans]SCD21220.1 Hypothetical protein PSM36_2416 [Proteiniphilum saccharofermentans]SEA46286.1 Protein of unknown function [Porphyromonadaceae bacterium KH3R12]SFT02177.1 Protein of unknown function [Porphyromonadaceae bacterium NLAE-zl-C104]
MLPSKCPSCQAQLKVKSLVCESCHTEVSGLYDLPLLAQLQPSEQDFIVKFVKSSGSLKEMAKELSLSYPTVRNLLNDIISKIDDYEK